MTREFKVGDVVMCVGENDLNSKKENNYQYAGDGWRKCDIFTISGISVVSNGRKYAWGNTYNGHGVYLNHLEPAFERQERKMPGVPGCGCRGCTNAREEYYAEQRDKIMSNLRGARPDRVIVDEAAPDYVLQNKMYARMIKLSHRWFDGGAAMKVLNNLTEKPEVKKMNYLQKLFLGADEKVLLEAGYIDSELDLTDRGGEVLEAIQVEAHKAKLVEMAKAEIAEKKAAAK
jgi:hypothetical protein